MNQLRHGVTRPNSYSPRPEQQACIDQISTLFKSGISTHALIAAVMRYGKTLAVCEIFKELGLKRMLIMTYKPAVDASWKEEVEKHVDFDGWKYYSAKDFSATDPIKLPGDTVEVLFTSFQDIIDINKSKWEQAKDYHYDLLVIDEMHYGSDTELARATLSQLSYDRVIYISGTAIKALTSGQFSDEETYQWRYTDQMALRRQEQLAGWKTETYRWSPVMNFHTFDVCAEAKANVLAYSDDEQFTMSKLFSTDKDGQLLDEGSVKLFTDQLFGRGGNRKQHSPMRLKPVDHSLWILPPNVKSATAFSRFLQAYLGNGYKIINVSGDNESRLSRVKSMIDGHDKTITVSCGRFNTGVTVPKWDMVVMLDDTKSPVTYFQTIFRCQSSDRARGKEDCHVIDFNPQRCLEMVFEFSEIHAKQGETTNSQLREWLDFAPILDHTGNTVKAIDVETVLNFMAKTGGYVERFGSNLMLNWSKLDDAKDMFRGIKPDKADKIKQQISDNDLDIGKNYLPAVAPNRQQHVPDISKKEYKKLRKQIMSVMRRIPTYLFLELQNITFDDTDHMIREGDPSKFKMAIGISLAQFRELCNDLEFVRKDKLDRCIMAYNQLGSF
jgi:hypothetical protein